MSGAQVVSSGLGGIAYGEFLEGSDLTFRAYLTNANGVVLTDSNVTGSVSLVVYQRSGSDPATPIYEDTAVTAATTAIVGLTTTGWTRGGSGYNFTVTLSSATFTQQAGMNYRFVFTVPLLAGGSFPVIFEMFCRGTA